MSNILSIGIEGERIVSKNSLSKSLFSSLLCIYPLSSPNEYLMLTGLPVPGYRKRYMEHFVAKWQFTHCENNTLSIKSTLNKEFSIKLWLLLFWWFSFDVRITYLPEDGRLTSLVTKYQPVCVIFCVYFLKTCGLDRWFVSSNRHEHILICPETELSMSHFRFLES